MDVQGHRYGVTSKFNKDETYNQAITNKTKIIEEIVAMLDNDTVLFISSSHGQVSKLVVWYIYINVL